MKSYVTMEQHACTVCGKAYDTGAVLLDRRLKSTFEDRTVTAMGLCEEHKQVIEDGYIILVGCDPEKTAIHTDDDGNIIAKGEDAYRTGELLYVWELAFQKIFNVPVPPQRICFVEPAVIVKLKQMMAPVSSQGEQDDLHRERSPALGDKPDDAPAEGRRD